MDNHHKESVELDQDETESFRLEARRILRLAMRAHAKQLNWRSKQIALAQRSPGAEPLRVQVSRIKTQAARIGVNAACQAIYGEWGNWSSGVFTDYDKRAVRGLLEYLKEWTDSTRWPGASRLSANASAPESDLQGDTDVPDEGRSGSNLSAKTRLDAATSVFSRKVRAKLERLRRRFAENPNESVPDAWAALGYSPESLRQIKHRLRRSIAVGTVG